MIIMTTDKTFTPTQLKRLRQNVYHDMMTKRQSGRSASGVSALMAIQWCEEHSLQWRLSGSHKGGYFVEVADNAAGGQRA